MKYILLNTDFYVVLWYVRRKHPIWVWNCGVLLKNLNNSKKYIILVTEVLISKS